MTFVTLLVFCICFSVGMIFLLEAKKRSGPYQKFFIPCFVAVIWIAIILPFLVAIPLTGILIENGTAKYADYLKVSFVGSAVIFIGAVTTFAILVNVFLQKVAVSTILDVF